MNGNKMTIALNRKMRNRIISIMTSLALAFTFIGTTAGSVFATGSVDRTFTTDELNGQSITNVLTVGDAAFSMVGINEYIADLLTGLIASDSTATLSDFAISLAEKEIKIPIIGTKLFKLKAGTFTSNGQSLSEAGNSFELKLVVGYLNYEKTGGTWLKPKYDYVDKGNSFIIELGTYQITEAPQGETLTAKTVNFNAEDQATALKDDFANETTYSVSAGAITIANADGTAVTEIKDAGTYTLTAMDGTATITQTVTVNSLAVNVSTYNQYGSFDPNGKFTAEFVDTTLATDAVKADFAANNGLKVLHEEIEKFGIGTGVYYIGIDEANASKNYTYTVVQNGIVLSAAMLGDVVGLITDPINNAVQGAIDDLVGDFIIDLGEFNKPYDGKSYAEYGGEEAVELANDVLTKLVSGLNDLLAGMGNVDLNGVSIPNVDLPSSIPLPQSIKDEIQKVIDEANKIINDLNSYMPGDSVDLNSIVATLAAVTPGVGLEIVETTGSLDTTVDVGDVTTLNLQVSLNVTLETDILADLIGLAGVSEEDTTVDLSTINGLSTLLNLANTLGLNLDTTVNALALMETLGTELTLSEIIVDLVELDLGVSKLPVTIYQEGTNSADNGGLFFEGNPESLEAHMTSDYFTVVNPLYYLLLSDDVKSDLATNTIANIQNNPNYAVTLLDMSDDAIYGEIADAAKDAIEFLLGEQDKLDERIADLLKKIDEAKLLGEEALLKLLVEYRDEAVEIYSTLMELEAKAKELKADILNGIDDVEKVIEKVESIIGNIQGIDTDAIKKQIEDALTDCLDKLTGLAEGKLETFIKLLEEKALELDAAAKAKLLEIITQLKSFIGGEIDKVIPAINNELAKIDTEVFNLDGAYRPYNGQVFMLNETAVLPVVTAAFDKVEAEINSFDVSMLEKVPGFTAEWAKLAGEFDKIDALIAASSTMTFDEFKAEVEKLDDIFGIGLEWTVNNTSSANGPAAGVYANQIVIYLDLAQYGITEVKFAEINFDLEIKTIDLDVVIDDQDITVGDAFPTYTSTVTGFANGDLVSVAYEVGLANTNTAGSSAITAVVTVTNAADVDVTSSYNINVTSGTLTISAGDNPNPTPTPSYSVTVNYVDATTGAAIAGPNGVTSSVIATGNGNTYDVPASFLDAPAGYQVAEIVGDVSGTINSNIVITVRLSILENVEEEETPLSGGDDVTIDDNETPLVDPSDEVAGEDDEEIVDDETPLAVPATNNSVETIYVFSALVAIMGLAVVVYTRKKAK